MKPKSQARIRNRLLASMIVVPLIPFFLVLGTGYYYFATSLETSTVASLERIVGDHRQMIDDFLSERRTDLAFILNAFPPEALGDPGNLFQIFELLQRQTNAFVDLGFFNEEGIHVNYQGPYKLVGRDYGKEAWFREVLQKGHYVSDVFLGFRRVPHFIVALAREEAGRKWVLRATIDTQIFKDLVKKVRLGRTGEAYILSQEGFFQTERRSGGGLMEPHPDLIHRPEAGSGIRTFMEKDARGSTHLYATTWLEQKDWLLVIRQEKADAFGALRSAVYLIAIIMILGGAGIIALAFYLTDRTVRLMEQMDRDRESLSDQLIRAGRLAELGEMAAGFAHEINNPLQIIKNEQALIDVLLGEMKERGELKPSEDLDELHDSMAQIHLQIGRCAEITQGILKFGRKSEALISEIDLRKLIPELTAMIAKRANVQGIVLRQEVSDSTPPIQGDPAQLQQVLLNLLNNAIDAITVRHGSEGGQLTIGAGARDGGGVEIFVRDNGCGISSQNLEKIFSPFFTTKPVGKGTGLGLSICYGIVHRLQGTLEVDTEEGSGTTFRIHLPAA